MWMPQFEAGMGRKSPTSSWRQDGEVAYPTEEAVTVWEVDWVKLQVLYTNMACVTKEVS